MMSTLRFFVPGLQYLSVMWDFVVRVDFPVSMVADALGPRYQRARRDLDRHSRNALVVPRQPLGRNRDQ